jgi:sugar phosphate isomerase/epimerase
MAVDLGIQLEVGICGLKPARMSAYLGIAQRLRAPLVRVVIDEENYYPEADEILRLLRDIVPDYQQAGVCLAIENHDRLPAHVLAGILNQIGSDALGVCLDTANSLGCGEDVFTVLNSLRPWIRNIHLKDFVPLRLPHKKGFTIEGCAAGQGVLDLPRLFAEFRRLPHDSNVVLELWPPPEANIAASVAKEEAWARQSIDHLRQFVLE